MATGLWRVAARHITGQRVRGWAGGGRTITVRLGPQRTRPCPLSVGGQRRVRAAQASVRRRVVPRPAGPLLKAQLTLSGCSMSTSPFIASMAACASL